MANVGIPADARASLPPWTLTSNDELSIYIRALTLKTMPGNFHSQTVFYIIWKALLLVIGLGLVFKLLTTGRWWIVRVVRMPRGNLICPNACEALVLAACVFYVMDIFYRGFSLDWHFDVFSSQDGMSIMYSLRLFFLWLAAFIHVASSALVWPLDPTQIRPLHWHLFLFGVPAAFLAAFVPLAGLSEWRYQQANRIAGPLLRQLALDPQAAVSDESAATAVAARELVIRAWKHTRQYAIVALAFLLPLTIATFATGFVIIRRSFARYRQIKHARLQHVEQHDSASIQADVGAESFNTLKLANAATDGGDPTGATSPHGHRQSSSSTSVMPSATGGGKSSSSGSLRWHELSRRRRLAYLVGLAPLRRIDAAPHADRGRPTADSVQAVLKDFLLFSVTVYACMFLIEIAMIACAALIIQYVLPDLSSFERVAGYGTPFVRVSYIFFVLEIWVIITLGTPLILVMLWRQVYPIQIDFSAGVYTRQNNRSAFQLHTMRRWRKRDDNVAPSDGSAALREEAERRESQQSNGDASRVVPAVFRNSIVDTMGEHAGAHAITINATPSTPAAATPGLHAVSNPAETMMTMRDACGVAGNDAGVRRIVLEALDAAHRYPGTSTVHRTSTLRRRAELEEQGRASPTPPHSASRASNFGSTRRASVASTRLLSSVGYGRKPAATSEGLSSLVAPESSRFVTPHGVVESRRFE